MKKRFSIIIVASFILFQGASPWEGSAAVAPNGELPVTGFYIATNAFPRNTVVEITNIETGKKTRVIVSNILTSPGLLAIVSREAAELIDMKAGSISRIRMEQPSDPLAYMQFIEKMAAGVPEYDSGNVIDENTLETDVYGNDTYMPPDLNDTVAESQKSYPSASRYIVDKDWMEDVNHIVDFPIPEESVEPVINPPLIAQPKIEDIEPEKNHVIEPEPEPELDPESKLVFESNPEPDPEPFILEEKIAKISENDNELSDAGEDPPIDFDNEGDIAEEDKNDIEEDLTPSGNLAELEQEEEKEEQLASEQPEQETSLGIGPAPPKPSTPTVSGIDRDKIIPSTIVSTPDRQVIPVIEERSQIIDPVLPVKMLDRLDRGKYYVQVTTQPLNLVMNTINHIDPSFDPKLLKGNDNLYRIMIGPLNQGESAAVLARFKSIGYKNAFVLMGG